MRKIAKNLITALLASTALAAAIPAQAQELDFDFSDEIVVRATKIPDEKRSTSEISSLLTEEKLERQGDSDIAEALRRVTGLSLSQGKFIVVRGLNERYSNLTLNGSPLPSPEPLRRVAPLDLFPVSVVGTALVQKTYSPEYSAEFGGGLIELRSKGLPNEPFLDLKLGATLDTETTGKDGLTFDGGEWDWAGFADSTYNVGPFLAGAINANPGVALRTDTGVLQPFEAQAIGAELVNAETRVIQEATTPANHSVTASGGARFDFDSGMSIGFVASAGYNRDWQTKVGRQGDAGVNDLGNGQFEAINGDQIFNFESQTETVRVNGLFATGIEFNENHELNLTGIVLRKSLKEARERIGTETATFGGFDGTLIPDGSGGFIPDGRGVFISNTEFFENQVWSAQANSEHVFPALSDLTIKLRGSYAEAYREAPYETEFVYVNDGTVGVINGVPVEFRSAIGLGAGASSSGFQTDFSQVDDTNYSGGLDIVLPFLIGDVDVTLKSGYAYNFSERDYLLRSFGFANNLTEADGVTQLRDDDPFFYQRIDFLLSDPNIGPDRFQFIEFPDQVQPQAYAAELEVHAAYFGADVQLTPYLRAAAGFRYESGEQFVDNFNIAAIVTPIPNGPAPESFIDEDYFLPAVTATWNPISDLQVRAGYSKTITRPQFQELGDALFTDTDRDITVIGNPQLMNTETTNYDIRAEYYFGREQYITIGGFYKDMTNPIEESLVNTGDDINTTYINAPAAQLYGVEFEYEQRFEMGELFKSGWLGEFGSTKDLVISANYTWSQSSVSTDGTVIANVPNAGFRTGAASEFFVDGRALQGQSDHIVNGQIGWEDYDRNSRLFILLNWSSERIRQVGLLQGAPVPNTVERLPLTVDLTYARQFEKWGGQWEIAGKIGNILNDDYEATADGANGTSVAIDVYDLGTTFSMSLKRSF